MRKQYPSLRHLAMAVTLLLPFAAHSQYLWEAGAQTGAANYLGDMGGNQLTRRDFVSDMKLRETRNSAGLFVRRKLNYDFSAKADLNWIRIAGDDKLSSNPGRNGRNLNFRNDLYEFTVEGQYSFYQVNNIGRMIRTKNKFNSYIGLGVGGVYHNPKTLYNGEWVALRPLQTEGKKYSQVAVTVPVTAGLYFTLNNQYRLGWNMSWRTTFTDYLDDVSDKYIAHPNGSLSQELANRSDELDLTPAFAANFAPGNKRGDPTHNDSYISTSVEFSYLMMGHSAIRRHNISEHPQYKWINSKFNRSPHRKKREVIW